MCLSSGQIAAASFLTNVMHSILINQVDGVRDGRCKNCGMTYLEVCQTGLECNDGKAEEANRDEAAKENAEANSADETRVAVEGDSGEGTDS